MKEIVVGPWSVHLLQLIGHSQVQVRSTEAGQCFSYSVGSEQEQYVDRYCKPISHFDHFDEPILHRPQLCSICANRRNASANFIHWDFISFILYGIRLVVDQMRWRMEIWKWDVLLKLFFKLFFVTCRYLSK
jgi:hypothetical protein